MMSELQLCTESNKYIIENLSQFYYYDLNLCSNLATIRLHNGRYKKMAYFENYWNEDNRYPYLILNKNEFIGFALVHDITINPKATWKLAEFFIMAPFRRQGIAKMTVENLFQLHQGLWEISVLKDNFPAINFWEKILSNDSKKLIHSKHPDYFHYEITSTY